jgi:hypothetical protein
MRFGLLCEAQRPFEGIDWNTLSMNQRSSNPTFSASKHCSSVSLEQTENSLLFR